MAMKPRGYLDWFFRSCKTFELRVMLVGESWSGKSTLLHQWKSGKFIHCRPRMTFGFDVGTFEYPQKCSWTVWNVTLGTDINKPHLRQYFQNTDVVIYVHDCDPRWDSSHDRTPYLHLWVELMLERKCQHLYIVSNKQDLLSPEQARDVAINLPQLYEKELARYEHQILWKIADHKISARTGEGVWGILNEVYHEVSRRQYPISIAPPSSRLTISNPRLTGRIRRGILVDPPDAATFWVSFTSADIPSWDHHVYLKTAYILVVEYMKLQRSTFAMADTFLAHLRILRLIQPQKFQFREHRTMTIFWLAQLQAAIIDYCLHKNLDRYPCWHDFYDIMFHQPSLQDPRLWRTYFTDSDLFCGGRAWDKWVSPSRQPLPSLAPPLDQPASLPLVYGGSGRLRRFAFTVIQYIHKSPADETDIIAQALSTLQLTTVRLRANGAGIPPYSKTHACYWIHMTRACLLSLDPSKSGKTNTVSQLSFGEFERLFQLKSSSWADYYSQTIWDALTSRIEFVTPDKKPLPHVINAVDCTELKVLEEGLEVQDTEKDQQSLEDILSATLMETGNVKFEVPSCCAQSVDCDWGIPTAKIKTNNYSSY